MNTLIFNRKGKLPADSWYHLEPSGKHLNRAASVTQVIDEKAVNAIVAAFVPGETGMLIDQEHFSHDADKSTEAYGWLMAVKNRGGELYGKIEWTDLGLPAVLNKRYVRFSTEYDPADVEVITKGNVRPLRLSGLTLTNRPNNLGGKPISNRENGKGDPADAPTKQKNMKNIAKALGLDEAASEGDILAAITKLKGDSSDEKKRADKADGELTEIRNREADDVLEKYKGVIGDDDELKKFWRPQIIANRVLAEKALGNTTPATPQDKPRIHNRGSANTPPPVEALQKKEDQVVKQRTAIDLIRNRDKCTFDQAFSRAQSENRELFQG